MLNWTKKFVMHHLLYSVLLLVLCLGIFPFIILYASSMFIARSLDQLSKGNTLADAVDRMWTKIGVPYDYLVQAVG